jgi:head-tail adaptor
MAGAGHLRERFTIQRRVDIDDGYGNTVGEWADQFAMWGGIRFMRGGEGVLAARLTARQPAILTVRNSTVARGILASDRAVNARTGEVFNIREQPRAARDNRGFLEMLVEAGVAT